MVIADVYSGQFILYFAENSPYDKIIVDAGILLKNVLAVLILDLVAVAP